MLEKPEEFKALEARVKENLKMERLASSMQLIVVTTIRSQMKQNHFWKRWCHSPRVNRACV